MQTVSTIGRDIAKSVFQVNGVDANGLVVIRSIPSTRMAAARSSIEEAVTEKGHVALSS
jgi:hypothetical protein